MIAGARAAGRWRLTALAAAVLLGVTACTSAQASPDDAVGVAAGSHAAQAAPDVATIAPRPTPSPTPRPPILLGSGFTIITNPAGQWVAAHPSDTRTPLIRSHIAAHPVALWLTGDESFGNLTAAVAQARKVDGTMTLATWNVPNRDDGLGNTNGVTLAAYKTWIAKVATTIGTTRAVLVLEPDALWFADRLPSTAQKSTRLDALRYAIAVLKAKATRTRVYIDAGTSSGSVTPGRMADLLAAVGVTSTAGFAVNVSSYSPEATITAYAAAIRTALQVNHHISDPRYVVDTSRNGASSWDNDWCNPPGQKLGHAPQVVNSAAGRDLDLWVKGPATSDGSCGVGTGTYGGQFMPSVAYSMITS